VKKWALLIDVERCTNCQNCVLATRDEHVGNDHPGYSAPMPPSGAHWISIERRTRGNGSMVDVTYVPKTCYQCEDAPCVRAAPDGAIYYRPDGIVAIDPIKSRGRPELVGSCPYGMISWNEAAGVPQKWSFDTHLLDAGWQQPRCTQACPTGAMRALRVSDEEFHELEATGGFEQIRPELGTRPRVLYRNLHKTSGLFLGGTVIRPGDEPDQLANVSEARVELHVPDRPLVTCLTDAFGDFKFDRLAPGEQPWTVHVSHPRFGSATARGTLFESRYLGTLELVRS
jgi:Fe-S-cluster-containing dehydrogenase component